jgi:hypothetical protein
VEVQVDAADAEVLPFLDDFTDKAALRLQAAARGFLVRRQAQLLRATKKRECEETEAAICLQAATRLFLARRQAGAALPQSSPAVRLARAAQGLSRSIARAQLQATARCFLERRLAAQAQSNQQRDKQGRRWHNSACRRGKQGWSLRHFAGGSRHGRRRRLGRRAWWRGKSGSCAYGGRGRSAGGRVGWHGVAQGRFGKLVGWSSAGAICHGGARHRRPSQARIRVGRHKHELRDRFLQLGLRGIFPFLYILHPQFCKNIWFEKNCKTIHLAWWGTAAGAYRRAPRR